MILIFSHDITFPLFFLIHHSHATSLFIVVLIHSFSRPTIVPIVYQLSHIPLCKFLFRKPFFFRKFRIQKLCAIYHGHSSINTGSFGYSISLAFVSSEILRPSQPPQCCYGQVGLFLGRKLLAPDLLSSISDLPSNRPHRRPQQRSPLSLS